MADATSISFDKLQASMLFRRERRKNKEKTGKLVIFFTVVQKWIPLWYYQAPVGLIFARITTCTAVGSKMQKGLLGYF